MRSLFRIYNKNYWVSVFGPILTFFVPIIITILICEVYTFSTSGGDAISLCVVVMPCLVFLSSYILMILILPQAIFEIKMSILVKQLKASSIKTWQILFVGIIYYSIAALIAFFLSFGAARLIGVINPSSAELIAYSFNQIDWATFIYVLIINLFVGCSLGMLFGSICTRPATVLLIGVIIIFLSCALAGFFAPLILSPSQHKGLWYVSYIDIIRYPVTSMFEAWYSKAGAFNTNGSSLFDFSTSYSAMMADFAPVPFDVFTPVDKILNIVVPYATIGLSTIFAIRFFRT